MMFLSSAINVFSFGRSLHSVEWFLLLIMAVVLHCSKQSLAAWHECINSSPLCVLEG